MRGFLITLAVLAVLLVGVDFAARWIVEDRVEAQVQSAQKLSSPPTISASGFPFLTQAIAGEYPSAHYRVDDVTYGSLRDVRIDADLTDVRVPFDQLISGSVSSIPAQRVDASVSLEPTQLAKLLRVEDVTVEPVTQADLDAAAAASDTAKQSLEGVDPAEAVKLTTTQSVAGIRGTVNAIATFKVSGGRVTLAAKAVSVDAGDSLPGVVAAAIQRTVSSRLSALSGTIDPGELPFGLTVTGVTAQDGRLVVTGTADDVDLLDPQT